ncbi:OmpA family protein [Fulvivirgaceae bacterium BMA12]|uniref:OmpA family protein n=1 Tax=Agaribacillus aureus TaxID=3051825 RepID=A0ABT8L6G9_9BACT|nr:OmpA family protein [Fulvivirgaceae bacterium BMA12]
MKKLLTSILLTCISSFAYSQIDSVIIKSIYFGPGSNYVDERQTLELFRLIDGIENLQSFQISITSHTDNIGGAEYNQWLSNMRSEAVIQKLLLKGIPMDQIHIKDFGQHNPLYNNANWQGRMKNRRVDIIFSPMIF